MRRIVHWFRWRLVMAFAVVAYWRLRLAGCSAAEAYDEVMLILRSSRLVRSKDGGDPWQHMQPPPPAPEGTGGET